MFMNSIYGYSEDMLKQYLISLGEKELNDIIEKDKKAELICHFCNKKYFFTEQELKKLVKRL